MDKDIISKWTLSSPMMIHDAVKEKQPNLFSILEVFAKTALFCPNKETREYVKSKLFSEKLLDPGDRMIVGDNQIFVLYKGIISPEGEDIKSALMYLCDVPKDFVERKVEMYPFDE